VINLHNFDQKYEQALQLAEPLVEKYPSNPLFQLIRGDLYAKLGRRLLAADCYRAAAKLTVNDPDCNAHIQELVSASLSSLSQRP
jgi:predicted Zn-dependent protease